MTDAEELATVMNWLDVEDCIERDIDRAVAASRKGDTALWIAGLFAARVVGKYQVDATREIARQAGRSVSAVENWCHAIDIYRRLRKFGVASELRQMRYELTITHFATMWELQRKYDINAHMCMRYLDQMCVYRVNGEPYSVEALRAEVEAHENKSGKVAPWNYGIKSLIQHMTRLAVATDAPEFVRQAARMFVKALEEAKV
jgi:hypothetical protein